MKSNLGNYSNRQYADRGEGRGEEGTDLKILVDTNNSRRSKSQSEEMSHRKPIPKLTKQSNADNSRNITSPTLILQRNRNVPPSRIDETLR